LEKVTEPNNFRNLTPAASSHIASFPTQPTAAAIGVVIGWRHSEELVSQIKSSDRRENGSILQALSPQDANSATSGFWPWLIIKKRSAWRLFSLTVARRVATAEAGSRKCAGRWLDPACDDRAKLEKLIKPFPVKTMAVRPVSIYVNNVKNQGEQCVAAPAG
jgi:hypothetical protein